MTSGLDRKTNLPNLTTEPPLDPPEPVDLKGEVRRRDQKQEMDAEIYAKCLIYMRICKMKLTKLTFCFVPLFKVNKILFKVSHVSH